MTVNILLCRCLTIHPLKNKNEKELKEIRKFANTLVFSLIQFDTVTPEMVNQIMKGNLEKFDSKILPRAHGSQLGIGKQMG